MCRNWRSVLVGELAAKGGAYLWVFKGSDQPSESISTHYQGILGKKNDNIAIV
ncbi:hypothetical protein HAALTHF_27920n [Vreelandella aquamarina]|nr:hypothetical protein HAALTHF_27920n [Halomonas axialensis]